MDWQTMNKRLDGGLRAIVVCSEDRCMLDMALNSVRFSAMNPAEGVPAVSLAEAGADSEGWTQAVPGR